ncbi:DUF5343 domain-containing protein, partial [Candidatus Sumerlaeota bacterium]|nr:DUF5343 domain-containing protein [Candidatus Sumerlaeota bacterium]
LLFVPLNFRTKTGEKSTLMAVQFLGTIIISYAKSLGFLDEKGVPTQLYKQFRNPSQSAVALAKGIMSAYKPLYERNEYFYNLTKTKIHELVCEETGQDHDNITAKRITNTLVEVKKLAKFDTLDEEVEPEDEISEEETNDQAVSDESNSTPIQHHVGKLGLAYNINLILPNTDDPKVFNAIFKSLKENLL